MPIIFSSTRKDVQAISSLTNYIFRHDVNLSKGFLVLHNIHWKNQSKEGLIKAFKLNDEYRKKRKGGVVVYHDILSFHPEDNNYLKQNPWVLESMCRYYMAQRSVDGLGFAKLHEDKKHLHIHVMLSANKKFSSENIRMSRKDFRILRRKVEMFQSIEFPQLKKSYIHPEVKKVIEQRLEENRIR